MKNVNVTIKDIAKAAGVSHPTVSRALNNHPAIAEATRERIIALAEQMGYVPNAAARGLKTNRTRALGVILRQIDLTDDVARVRITPPGRADHRPADVWFGVVDLHEPM